MPIGFILIKTTPTFEHEVYTKISKLPQVIVHPLFSEYDLIAIIETEDLKKLGMIVWTNLMKDCTYSILWYF